MAKEGKPHAVKSSTPSRRQPPQELEIPCYEPPPRSSSELLSLQAAADQLGVAASTLLRWLNADLSAASSHSRRSVAHRMTKNSKS